MRELRTTFPTVQLALELTIKDVSRVCELFEHAETLVLYPASPLFDVATQQLTESFLRALKLIFRLADNDRDGELSDFELQELNERVYGVSLAQSELASIKAQVEARTGGRLDFRGFAIMQEMLIRDLNTYTCWELLDAHHFNHDLALNQETYTFHDCPTNPEWSETAIEFLQRLFDQYANGEDLSYSGLREIFSPVEAPPWSPKDPEAWENVSLYCETTPEGRVSLDSWLSLWQLLLVEDQGTALKYIVYLGYSLSISLAVTNRKTVFIAAVIGGKGCGKKTLLEWFLHKPLDYHPDSKTRSVCGVLQKEADFKSNTYLILSTESVSTPDLYVLLYDSDPDSKGPLKEFVRASTSQVPKLLVLNKTNPEDSLTVYEFAIELNLSNFEQVCLKQVRPDSLFTQISSLLKKSSKVSTLNRREHRSVRSVHTRSRWGWWAMGAGLVSVFIGLLLKRQNFKLS
mmetsp:Transcript_7725/g.14621  ORF Transcript_7725/g.14621 Transcript_7725/m.14621 type:complete len:460 (-) Transcript_7725:1083-2462(-)